MQQKANPVGKAKKVKKLYRCTECTNSVTITINAKVSCTRCHLPMRLFEAEQSTLFLTPNPKREKQDNLEQMNQKTTSA